MPDHAGKCQPPVGRIALVEVTAGEVGVVENRHLLLEVVETLQRRCLQTSGDRDDDRDALGIPGGETETHLPADRPTDDGVETVDPEMVEQPDLAVDDVVEGHCRKARPVVATRHRVEARRPGRPVAPTQVVDAEHGETVGIDGAARPDEGVPPSQAALLGPPVAYPGHHLVPPSGVLAPGESMDDQNHVVSLRGDLAIQLVGQGHLSERCAALEAHRIVRSSVGEEPSGGGTDRSTQIHVGGNGRSRDGRRKTAARKPWGSS